MGMLEGRRVLMVGASAGIGRELAIRLVREGARVVMAARREEALKETVAQAGGGLAVSADISSPDDCGRVAAAAREHLGGVDILISSVGAAPLRAMADTGLAEWRAVFDTNVIGFHQLVTACLDTFAPNAFVGALSSEAVDQPRWALGAYAASKVALERTIASWRLEHPELRFCRIRVGQTAPTDFGTDFDPATLSRAMADWAARGIAPPEYMTPQALAEAICGLLTVAAAQPAICLEDITLRASSAGPRFDQARDEGPDA